jgi:uncharacterized protein YjdB
VTWTSDNAAVTVDPATGVVTGAAAGNANVTATHAASGLHSSAAVSVTGAALVSLTVTPDNVQIPGGMKQPFRAAAVYADGTQQDVTASVTWSVLSGPGSIDAQGVYQADGTGSVTVEAMDAQSHSGTAPATVVSPAVVSLTMVPSGALSLPAGSTLQLRVTAWFTDHSAQDVTSSVSWQTSSEAGAYADENGLLYAYAAGGPYTITANGTYLTDCEFCGTPNPGSRTATLSLTVTAPVQAALAVTPQSPSIAAGTTRQFSAFLFKTDGSSTDVTSSVTWSSDSAAVTVDGTGLATAHSTGTAHVTATDAAHGLSAGSTVTVTGPVLGAILIAPGEVGLDVGATAPLTAIGWMSDGSTVAEDANVTWSTDAPAVATVSGGVVTAFGGITGARQVSVLIPTAPHLIGDITYAGTPKAAAPGPTVTALVSSDATSAYGIFYDAYGVQRSAGFSLDATQSPAVGAPNKIGCLAVGKRLAFVPTGLSKTSAQSEYSLQFGHSHFSLYQYSNLGTYLSFSNLTSPQHITWTDPVLPPDDPSSCFIPVMTSAPVLDVPPVQGGTSNATIGFTSGATQVNLYLYDAAQTHLWGSGSANFTAGPTSMAVPMKFKCLAPTGPASLFIQVETSTSYTEYYYDKESASTFYSYYQGDGIGYSDTLISTFPLLTISLGAGTCQFPQMTAGPTYSSTTVTKGTSVTVTVPVSTDANNVYVTFYNTLTGGYGGGSSKSFTAGGTSTSLSVPIPGGTPSGTYYPQVQVGAPAAGLYKTYSQKQGSPDYWVQPYDGTFYGLQTDAGFALTTITVP